MTIFDNKDKLSAKQNPLSRRLSGPPFKNRRATLKTGNRMPENFRKQGEITFDDGISIFNGLKILTNLVCEGYCYIALYHLFLNFKKHNETLTPAEFFSHLEAAIQFIKQVENVGSGDGQIIINTYVKKT